ncbi:MAG: hypothetical protein ACFFEY_02885 [Candidatus Thorarchaeota archaeon]
MVNIKQSKLVSKTLLSVMAIMAIFGLTATARAGIPPFYWQYATSPIISWGFDVQINDDQSCLWGVATAVTEWEIETGFFPKQPFDHKLYIDGEKVPLQRFTFIDRDGSIFGYPNTKWWVHYHFFEADDFDVGVYNIEHQMWVQKPYAGSEMHGWRIFVNYEGPVELYGEVDEPLILTYTLTVV